ncbi:glycosyltransferase [bacterium]|nr:glycosyltransferase [bacterium]
MNMKDIDLELYKEKVKDYQYFKIVKNIIKILSGNEKTILDIGSAGIDLMSEYPFKERYSVATYGAINNDRVTGYEMDFFDFEVKEKFDVITCLQVVEHVEKAKEFVQKILKSGKLCIISVPYKWEKGACKYHVQDPIDEMKMYDWSETKPLFTFWVKDRQYRMVLVYGELNNEQKLKLLLLNLKYFCSSLLKNKSFYNNFFEILFSVKNDRINCFKIFTILGFNIKIKSKKLKHLQLLKQYEDFKYFVEQKIKNIPVIGNTPIKGRICYFLNNSIPYFNGGYASRSHFLSKSLKASGFDIIPITRPGFPYGQTENILQEETFDNITYVRMKSSLNWEINNNDRIRYLRLNYLEDTIKGLEEIFKNLKPEYIMATTFVEIPALIVAKKLGIPFLYEVRGLQYLNLEDNKKNHVVRELLKYTAKMVSSEAKAVFTLTEQMKKELINLGVDKNKISLIPNCADLEKFKPMDKDIKLIKEFNLQNKVVIGYIGTFAKYEGLDDLIKACNILNKKKVDFKLLLVCGETAIASARPNKKLVKLVKRYKLNDKIMFLGKIPLEDVPRYYSVMDIVAIGRKPLPVCETVSPIKPLEAMAMEKTVVVSSVQALKEIVEDSVTGLIFEKGNINSYAQILEKAINDADLRERLGKNARIWVKENRQWTVNTRTIASVMEKEYAETMF